MELYRSFHDAGEVTNRVLTTLPNLLIPCHYMVRQNRCQGVEQPKSQQLIGSLPINRLGGDQQHGWTRDETDLQ